MQFALGWGEFRKANYYQFEIINDGKIVGTLRVKPASILWRPKGARKWRGVDLKTFAEYIMTKGTVHALIRANVLRHKGGPWIALLISCDTELPSAQNGPFGLIPTEIPKSFDVPGLRVGPTLQTEGWLTLPDQLCCRGSGISNRQSRTFKIRRHPVTQSLLTSPAKRKLWISDSSDPGERGLAIRRSSSLRMAPRLRRSVLNPLPMVK